MNDLLKKMTAPLTLVVVALVMQIVALALYWHTMNIQTFERHTDPGTALVIEGVINGSGNVQVVPEGQAERNYNMNAALVNLMPITLVALVFVTKFLALSGHVKLNKKVKYLVFGVISFLLLGHAIALIVLTEFLDRKATSRSDEWNRFKWVQYTAAGLTAASSLLIGWSYMF